MVQKAGPLIRGSQIRLLALLLVLAATGAVSSAATPATGAASMLSPPGGDIPAHFNAPTAEDDYIKREMMIPMRDGVRLYTVIVVPKGAHNAPILLTRTPYNATNRARRSWSTHMLATLPEGDEEFVSAGYIRVFQDIRGKYKSEGTYVMTLPVRGPLNPGPVDEVTDAWDTIDWLVKHTPESNGRVGMIGSSYEGFTVAMALLDPHPALKVAAPESPMVDGWMGDDWYHYGAFRQIGFDYFVSQTTARGEGESVKRGAYDDYEAFLRAGSAGDYAQRNGIDQLPWWQRLAAHPAYDEFWQDQALDHLIVRQRLRVPTMWIQGLWDQEDMWGAVHCYMALKAAGTPDELNHLVMGPWRHSQVNYDGYSLGPLRWEGDTTRQFRRDVLLPFFNYYLKGGRRPDTPVVEVYNTGELHWDRLKTWPRACQQGCQQALRPLYLSGDFALSFVRPMSTDEASDHYVSDPAKPVPFVPRPVRFSDADAWHHWLVDDQRFVAGRTDVLSYETPPLTAPIRISGAAIADLYASTSGTDADWVVKLIDVFPDQVPSQPDLGGYQLAVAMDILRGRYRNDFSHPSPIPANTVQRYRFALPPTNHVFLPGHRIMVQVQSSWFPLYDRNPQTYVPNIFFARPADYASATQRIFRSGADSSAVWLPIVP
jgi:uncharacterized protein